MIKKVILQARVGKYLVNVPKQDTVHNTQYTVQGVLASSQAGSRRGRRVYAAARTCPTNDYDVTEIRYGMRRSKMKENLCDGKFPQNDLALWRGNYGADACR